jgi:hypothetical protein
MNPRFNFTQRSYSKIPMIPDFKISRKFSILFRVVVYIGEMIALPLSSPLKLILQHWFPLNLKGKNNDL